MPKVPKMRSAIMNGQSVNVQLKLDQRIPSYVLSRSPLVDSIIQTQEKKFFSDKSKSNIPISGKFWQNAESCFPDASL